MQRGIRAGVGLVVMFCSLLPQGSLTAAAPSGKPEDVAEARTSSCESG